MTEKTRAVPTHIGDDGRPTAKLTLSPLANTVRAEVEAPPDEAIPVVFVPGVMGSPLLALAKGNRELARQGRWAWFPDDTWWVIGTKDPSYRRLSPAQRKILLDPAATSPLTTAEHADRKVVEEHVEHVLPVDEALRRGWGSVMLGSYADVLKFLDMQLRYIVDNRGDPSRHPRSAATRPRAMGTLERLYPALQCGSAQRRSFPLSGLRGGLQLAQNQWRIRQSPGRQDPLDYQLL